MQGKISDFSIPDIFQLVSSQGKSGSLAVRGADFETVFLFSEGMIVDVQPDRRDPSGMLGTMLVDAGLLTESAFLAVRRASWARPLWKKDNRGDAARYLSSDRGAC